MIDIVIKVEVQIVTEEGVHLDHQVLIDIIVDHIREDLGPLGIVKIKIEEKIRIQFLISLIVKLLTKKTLKLKRAKVKFRIRKTNKKKKLKRSSHVLNHLEYWQNFLIKKMV